MPDIASMFKLGAVGILLSAIAWLYQHGREIERAEWTAATQQALAETTQQVRQTEQRRYGDLLNALNTQYLAQRDIAGRLSDDLERLRQRPDRRPEPVPGDPAAASCNGATGRELSAADAEFLVRIAALCANTQTDLRTYRRYADSLGE